MAKLLALMIRQDTDAEMGQAMLLSLRVSLGCYCGKFRDFFFLFRSIVTLNVTLCKIRTSYRLLEAW